MAEVLNYRLGDSAGGLWRRLWSMGYSVAHPKPKETAKDWLNRDGSVRAMIQEIKTGRLNDAKAMQKDWRADHH